MNDIVKVNKLKKWQEDQGYTNKSFGKLTGIDPSIISRYHTGERMFTVDNMYKVIEFTGLSFFAIRNRVLVPRDQQRNKSTN